MRQGQAGPKTAVIQENIDAAEKLLRDDPSLTHGELTNVLKIGSGSVASILHEHLDVTKRSARWVTHNITE